MKQLQCPKCGTPITIDRTDYNTIVNQVRNDQFETEIQRRLTELAARYKAEQTVETLKTEQKYERLLREHEETIADLNNRLQLQTKETMLREANLKDTYELRLKEKQEQVDYYKDLKARLSTKMIGETLETHCSNQFNRLRATAYPAAYFEKDNDTRTGSKGDFIFRDYIDGEEYISIMFEMKNEADTTATKHRNEDFLAKLDKDRNDKKCEYAILVSLLEPDNELYNEGIVDLSYRYPKTYVIRPQFFMPIISLLTQSSRKAAQYRRELAIARQQTIDVTNFENKLNDFRDRFSGHYRLASQKFNSAIDEIDKTIKSLTKMRDYLLSSENYLRLAGDDTEKLTIRSLTRGNPTMKQLLTTPTPDSPKTDSPDTPDKL